MPREARERIENLWDRATPVGPLLDEYRAEVLREAADAIEAEYTGHGTDRYVRYAAGSLRRMVGPEVS
ncbi:hypothetical protein ACFUJU_07740 [Streptomyces sp. NPDC057235]|uniref:hypothetical protein n=1 Tax=Streptomyces sp. NPDC057235 TaxID=3346058 RepID=UPI0036285789